MDCGAAGNFITQAAVDKFCLPVCELSYPVYITAVDGSRISKGYIKPGQCLTRKGADHSNWSEDALAAFQKIKLAFMTAPVLLQPDVDKPFELEVDASTVGVGAVLSQIGADGKVHPCGFFTRKFLPAEVDYSIGDQELLAIKLALEEWRYLLEGAKFSEYQRRRFVPILESKEETSDPVLHSVLNPVVFASSQVSPAPPPAPDLVPLSKALDLLLQNLTLDVYVCQFLKFSLDFYQQIQTLIHTIEEINRDPNILPNVTLGFQMYDTCTMANSELQGALQFLTEFTAITSSSQCSSRPSFMAIIGSTGSTNSMAVANVLGIFRYPQVSPYSSISLLSDRKMFPSFFRTVSNDKFQSIGLAELVLRFGWSWVGLVTTDNNYGLLGIQSLKQEIMKSGTCIAFTEYSRVGQPDRNAPHIVRVIKESSAKVVIVFCVDVDFIPVANELLKQNITGKIFIGNADWSRSIILSAVNYFPILSGTLGLAGNDFLVPGLNQFLSKIRPSVSIVGAWENLYWEKNFSCKFLYGKHLTGSLETPIKECTGEERIDDVKNSSTYINSLKYSYATHSSVMVLAKALDDARSCKTGDGPFSYGTCADIWNLKPWQLTHYIRKVRPALINGNDTYFDKNGEPPVIYSVVNWQQSPEGTVKLMKIGNYSTTAPSVQTLTINSSLLMWPMGHLQVPRSACSESCSPGYRKAAKSGHPVCCYDCVQCLQGEISNKTDSLNCIRCPWDQWPSPEKSRCLPKSMEFLSYEDTLGGTLAAISIISSLIPALILSLFIFHRQTPVVKANNYSLSCLLLMSLYLCFLCSLVFIGYPHHKTCLLRQVLFGLAFTLCISSILAKTILVVLAFMATRPGSNVRRWMSHQVSYMIIITCFLLQFILCITWLSIASPFPQYNTEIKPGLIIVECNEGSPFAFWTMLGYLFLLATISFIVAFLARKLPDRFNEAQFITFSMLAFLSVWVSFIPASLSAQGKYTVAMEIFAILASSWALVICMFLPKCFIIVFRPDQNFRLHIIQNNG
ncbi:extracellular calcium-sensing receptor-like [Pseudophryne corroboree]|uniref:extracellular calcium-sensing receptor-like n=1 Tax=Pseudophryne corroboree TaxID=495146 RepID=UPI0030821A1F